MPVKIIVGEDQLKRATIIVSSAIRLVVGGRAMLVKLASNHHTDINGRRGWRLVVGGRAMLVKLASNHHTDINGRRGWRPRVRIRMRLCVRS